MAETRDVALLSSVRCPYCRKAVTMSRGHLGDHNAPAGPCYGAGREVAELDHLGFAVFPASP